MRKGDKLTYRYPRGESYLDVMQRLDTARTPSAAAQPLMSNS